MLWYSIIFWPLKASLIELQWRTRWLYKCTHTHTYTVYIRKSCIFPRRRRRRILTSTVGTRRDCAQYDLYQLSLLTATCTSSLGHQVLKYLKMAVFSWVVPAQRLMTVSLWTLLCLANEVLAKYQPSTADDKHGRVSWPSLLCAGKQIQAKCK